MTGVVLFFIVVVVAYKWANAIDDMKNLHPDYKGEDFP